MTKVIRTPQDWFEEQQQKEATSDTIPDNIPILELAEQVVRGKVKLSPQQVRMLIELLPFYAPKLSAVAHGTLNGDDFASRLERSVARSDAARFMKLIEAKASDEPTD